VTTRRSPSIFAERRTPERPLSAVSTSLTLSARERSTVAVAPEESVTWMRPRATPAPPLSVLSLVSRSRRPRAFSKVMEVRPRPVEVESVKPWERICCEEASRSTRSW